MSPLSPREWQCVAVCCSVLHCAAVCCSVWQCVAVMNQTRKILHYPNSVRLTYVFLRLTCVFLCLTCVFRFTCVFCFTSVSRTHDNMMVHIITATYCNTLQHTATHCNTLQHTATHCNTLQHTATHCDTLQHTALLRRCRVLLQK